MQPVVLLQQERKRSREKGRKRWRDRKVKGGGKRGRGEQRERGREGGGKRGRGTYF